jgi:hypothetical protein
MIKQSILTQTRSGHAVFPQKDGKVYVHGQRAYQIAKTMFEKGEIASFKSISEMTKSGMVFQAIVTL